MPIEIIKKWWPLGDLNSGPLDYQSSALGAQPAFPTKEGRVFPGYAKGPLKRAPPGRLELPTL